MTHRTEAGAIEDLRDRWLAEADWRERQAAHAARADALCRDHLDRRRHGLANPVLDFLFTYYRTRPAKLRVWHPGVGVRLAGDRDEAAAIEGDPWAVVRDRRDGVAWMHRLLASVAGRPPSYGCFGLHEWAMVYGLSLDDVRHTGLPLRVAADTVAEVVDERGLRCTHFDAYRFFTPPARPRNATELTRGAQPETDRQGCVHVAMDLYRYATKLMPATSGELVLDCFELARDARIVDMRASPYDVGALGWEPIMIETAPGRAAYVTAQRDLVDRAAPLRERLLAVTTRLLTTPGSSPA